MASSLPLMIVASSLMVRALREVFLAGLARQLFIQTRSIKIFAHVLTVHAQLGS